jgi:polar amino acid transport system substrate-binding protein
VALAFVALVAYGAVTWVHPTQAQALTCDKATARPNEDGGDGVIGGETTRLTWEGTVDSAEDVTKVTLAVPEGGSFDGSTTRVTVLAGLNRQDVSADTETSGTSLVVTFGQAIPEGSLVRLEVTGMSFPADGGDYTITGTYETNGETRSLPESPSISVIANTPLQAAVSWLDGQAWVTAWNSNQFLGMFFKPQLLLTSFVSLFSGWVVCLGIVVVAYPIAIVLGLCFAFMKLARHRVVRAIAVTYINVLRGTPLFLQIYIMFFGLPMVGVNINNNVLGVIVMAVNSSAYLAEIFRAGIQSIPQGQYEAAASLGMNRAQTMVSIILPQTVRRVIPTVTSDFITSYKDTSLLSSVGVMELMMFSKNLTTVSGNITPYMAAAIYYLIVTLPLIKVVGIIEKNIARSESGSGPRPKAGKARLGTSQKAPEAAAAPTSVQASVRKPSAWGALMAPFKAGGHDDADEVIARIEADAVPAAGGMRGGASDAC